MAAAPVLFRDNQGMVLYYLRSTTDLDLLCAVANERCLLGYDDLIGVKHAI